MNKSISIIIPSRNGIDHLKRNLPILINNLEPSFSRGIILVDNGSSDGSAEFVQNNYPGVKVLAFPEILSFAEACNLGAEAAKNQYLFFLNSDVRVTPNFLPPLLHCFEDPAVFAVTPAIIVPKMENINEALTSATFKGGAINTDFYASQRWGKQPDQAIPVLFGCGAALMVEKEKFRQLGGFDPLFSPFYFEDLDLSYRAQKRGWKILCQPNSVVYHEKEGTIASHFQQNQVFAYRRKNHYLFIWKNIFDRGMLFSHLLELVLLKIIIPNPTEWSGLWQAFRLLPKALAGRRQEAKFQRIPDRAIIQKAAYLLEKGEAPWQKHLAV